MKTAVKSVREGGKSAYREIKHKMKENQSKRASNKHQVDTLIFLYCVCVGQATPKVSTKYFMHILPRLSLHSEATIRHIIEKNESCISSNFSLQKLCLLFILNVQEGSSRSIYQTEYK